MHDLRLLRSFVHAAQSRSFTAAASILDCTPGAISRNIAKLEHQAGVRLFNRTTREFSLTEEGAEFYEAVSAGLSQLDRADDVISRVQGETSGIVRLSVGSFGKVWATTILRELLHRHSGLQFEVAFIDNPGDLVAHNYDLAIRTGKLDDSGYICRKLGRLKLVLVASPDYVRRFGEPTHPAELRLHDCINVRETGASCAWRFFPPEHPCENPVDIDPPCRFRITEHTETVLAASLAGLGPTVVSADLAEPHLKAGTLVELLGHWTVRPQGVSEDEVYLCYPHRSYVPARVRIVIDAFAAGFAVLPKCFEAAREFEPSPADMVAFGQCAR
jgi:DNA-binding transcriptional LysR family regulator